MPKVTVYTGPSCGYCTRAKMLLKNKGVDFEEIDVSNPADRQAMMQRTGGARAIPQIFIGDMHVGGSDKLFELERNGELDDLLGDNT